MKSPSVGQRVLAVAVATLLLALSGTMAWAAVNDFEGRTYVPFGVTLAGVDMSGMDEAAARQAIEDAVADPLTRPIQVMADGRQFTFDPRGAVEIDVDAMLDAAFEPRRTAAFVTRLRHDLGGIKLETEIEPVYSVDEAKTSAWIAEVAGVVDRPAVDASRTVVVNKLVVTRSATGRKLVREQAEALLVEAFQKEQALSGAERSLKLPVERIKPKVRERSFGKTIVVDLSERRIRLYNIAELEKTYPCAIGTPQFPTPKGEFEIVLKRYRPTWVNPGSGWAKTMPQSIPPGPGNPLGTRALNLSASGIRFHGTENIGSVGTAASHGCMRMYRSDIEDLYDRVEVGTKVFIVP